MTLPYGLDLFKTIAMSIDAKQEGRKFRLSINPKSFSEEEDNYLRVCLLLKKIGTQAVFITFEQYHRKIIKDFDISSTLREKIRFHSKTLEKDNRFKDSQRSLLYQTAKANTELNELEHQLENIKRFRNSLPQKDESLEGKIKDLVAEIDQKYAAEFDISLMTLILETSDNTEVTVDEDTKNALQVIKKHRNEKVAHNLSAGLSNEELNTVWDDIAKAIKHLGGDRLEQECHTLRNATPDSSYTQILNNIDVIRGFIKDYECDNSHENKTTDNHFKDNGDDEISKQNNENFVRVCWLLIQIAPIGLRHLFKKVFFEKREKTSNGLKIEWKRFFEDSVKDVNPENCDLPLMLFLLKHDKGFRISDKELPDPLDTRIDADLTRIYFYTQFIVDNRTTRSLDTSAFIEIWDTVVKAIVRLGGDQMKQQCDCLKIAVIGENIKGSMLGLIEIQGKMTVLKQKLESDLSKAIKDNEEEKDNDGEVYNEEEIDKWLDEDKMFVETEVSIRLQNHLRNEQNKCITVVGSFGVGKTFTTRHVALILRHEGYKIRPVSSLDEVKKLCVKGNPTIFIVDDFCSGSIIKRGNDIKMWEKMYENLLGSKSKIVVCCTLMLYQHSSFKSARLSFFRSCVLDMNSSYALTSDELRCVAKRHTDMDDTLIQEYSSEFPFFPFLCRTCSLFCITRVEGKHISKFKCHEAIFKNAMEVYKFQLSAFYTDDKLKYTALALIVQLNNYVEEECFTEPWRGKTSVLHKINTTLDSCKFDKNKSLSDLEYELKSMIGSFVVVRTDSKNSLVYSAINLSVYEMLSTYFKKELPEYFSGKFPVHKKYKKLQ